MILELSLILPPKAMRLVPVRKVNRGNFGIQANIGLSMNGKENNLNMMQLLEISMNIRNN